MPFCLAPGGRKCASLRVGGRWGGLHRGSGLCLARVPPSAKGVFSGVGRHKPPPPEPSLCALSLLNITDGQRAPSPGLPGAETHLAAMK